MRTAAGWAVALVTILLALAIPASFAWSVSYVAKSRIAAATDGMIVLIDITVAPFDLHPIRRGLQSGAPGGIEFSVLPKSFYVNGQPMTHFVPLHMIAVPLGLLAWFLLRPALRAQRRRRRGCCLGCGYDLTGNESGVCPECGQAASGAQS